MARARAQPDIVVYDYYGRRWTIDRANNQVDVGPIPSSLAVDVGLPTLFALSWSGSHLNNVSSFHTVDTVVCSLTRGQFGRHSA